MAITLNGTTGITTPDLSVDTNTLFVDAANNRVGVGTTSPLARLQASTEGTSTTPNTNVVARFVTNGSDADAHIQLSNGVDHSANIGIAGGANLYFANDGVERARIDASGNLLVGTTSLNFVLNAGIVALDKQGITVTKNNTANLGSCLYLGRMAAVGDGNLVEFAESGVVEGTISVSGTTVSYNGGHLSRWAQFPDNSRPELLKGTVMSNLDQMSNWDGEENEQLNCVQVSTVEGDPDVAGVFVAWDSTDDEYNDILLAMTGDMVIRIGAGVTVSRGDLLMSAGDGTAKPQGDDIVRSKTIAKVTSTHVSHTYEDGSYAVPCVLMAC